MTGSRLHACPRCRCPYVPPAIGAVRDSHIWSRGEDDEECLACGVTWEDCDEDCPGVTA